MTFAEWAQQTDTQKIYLVELTALKVADLSPLTLYLANYPVALNDHFYIPCVKGLPRLSRQANDTLDPNHVPSWGELEIFIEPDYCPDPANSIPWSTLLSDAYNFAGQALTIKLGGEDFAYGDYVAIFTGYIGESPKYDGQLSLTLTLYDKSYLLEKKEIPDYELPDDTAIPESNRGKQPPIVLGRVKNYSPILIHDGSGTNNKYILAAHVINALKAVYVNGISLGSSTFTQKDVSPVYRDAQGSATATATGPYTGSLTAAKWLIQIDSITTPNTQGAAGQEVGLATFRWSLDNGATWEGEGVLTWKLTWNNPVKSPSVGNGTMELSGEYTGDCKLIYRVKVATAGHITGIPAPQIIWSDDDGDTWSDPVDLLDNDPIELNRGISAAFDGNASYYELINTWSGATSTVTFSQAGTTVTITSGGEVGVATFDWDDGLNSGSDVTAASVVLSNGCTVTFAGTFSYGDTGSASNVLREPFTADDEWTWNFKEIPIPLADGVYIQFFTQAGDDFELGDEFSFILISTLTCSPGSNNDVKVEVEGKISSVTDAYVYKIGDIIHDLLTTYAGWGAADIDVDAITAFNTSFPYVAGLLVDSPTSMGEIIDSLLTGLPALYTIKLNGKFYLAEIAAPAASPQDTLSDIECLEFERQAEPEKIFRRVYLNWERCWETNTADQDVTAGYFQWAKNEWRRVQVRDNDILLSYPLALDLGPLDTCLVSPGNIGSALDKANITALANKLLTLYRTSHPMLTVTVKNQPFIWDIWDTVRVNSEKLGINNELFAIIGMEHDYAESKATLTLWR